MNDDVKMKTRQNLLQPIAIQICSSSFAFLLWPKIFMVKNQRDATVRVSHVVFVNQLLFWVLKSWVNARYLSKNWSQASPERIFLQVRPKRATLRWSFETSPRAGENISAVCRHDFAWIWNVRNKTPTVDFLFSLSVAAYPTCRAQFTHQKAARDWAISFSRRNIHEFFKRNKRAKEWMKMLLLRPFIFTFWLNLWNVCTNTDEWKPVEDKSKKAR